MRSFIKPAGLALLSLTLACSDPTEIGECHGQIQMSVNAAPNPVFSWTPECKISYLAVEDRGDGTGYWTVSSPPGQKIIEPPVAFGVVPDGAIEDGPSNPLEPGGAYRVIALLVSEDDFTIVRIGEAPFNR